MSLPEMKNCPYCDERIRAVARICRYCRSELVADDEPRSPSGDARLWIGLILVGAFTVIFSTGVALFGILHGGGEQKPAASRRRITSAKEVEEKVIMLVSELLNVPKEGIRRETALVADLKADSLDLVEIILELEDEFGIRIPDEDISRLQTIGSAVDYIMEKQ